MCLLSLHLFTMTPGVILCSFIIHPEDPSSSLTSQFLELFSFNVLVSATQA